jgi:hypothetical protein
MSGNGDALELYDRSNVARLPRDRIANLTPDQVDYLAALVAHTPAACIDNVPVAMVIVRLGDVALPATVNDGDAVDCHLVSPLTHYLAYGSFELRRSVSPTVRRVTRVPLDLALAIYRRTSLGRVVHVNNWLLPTNPRLSLGCDEIAALTRSLASRFPTHALVFRTLESGPDEDPLLQRLEEAGYRRVYYRPVYLFDGSGQARRTPRDVVNDMRLLRTTDLRTRSLEKDDACDPERLAALYRHLYIDRYTPLNPAYNATFFRIARESGFIRFQTLHGERIEGFASHYVQGARMTAAMCGYDTTRDQRMGLYRLVTAVLIRAARENRRVLNLSGGVGRFKMNRGAVAVPECEAVFDRHLPSRRRVGWAFVRLFYNSIGRRLARRLAI